MKMLTGEIRQESKNREGGRTYSRVFGIKDCPERQTLLISTPEDKILAGRCRELMDRFGLDKPAEVAIVLRISLERADHLLKLAQLR